MSTESKREPMTLVDSTWLGMDRPTNPMVINGVMLFDKPIDFERLKRVIDERFAGRFERFRQRVVEHPEDSGHMYWEADPHYDIRAHVYHIALPAPGDTETLQRLVSALVGEPMERSRPLWRYYLIDNYGGGCAVFGRLHHCLGDGVALIRVLLSMTDRTPDGETKATPEAELQVQKARGGSRLSLPFKLAGDALSLAANVTGTVVKGGRHVIEDPGDALAAVRSAGILAATSTVIVAKLLLMTKDRPSVYRGELSPVKRVLWTDPLRLEDVKVVAKALGATINDVLVSVVAGSLRRYLLGRGDDVTLGSIRAMVPVNLRAADAEPTLGNQFSLVYLGLPVDVADPYMRLAEVKRQMDILKHSPEPMLVYEILTLLGMIPGELAHWATDWFATKASAVLTNVPGPREALYLAGQKMRRMIFWVPQTGGIGMGISIFSYAGEVNVGLMVDNMLVPDPEVIIAGFDQEFAELGRVAQAVVRIRRAEEEGADSAAEIPVTDAMKL